MVCLPLRGDYPRAQGVSYLKYKRTSMVLLVYTTYISVDLAHHEIVCAKVGKGFKTNFHNNFVLFVYFCLFE